LITNKHAIKNKIAVAKGLRPCYSYFEIDIFVKQPQNA
jgi:hypothetical protein